ncbi:MAG: glycosyltransferase [Gemmatimonadetes bacterium]|nr:glycosyltransferase [Gemmatimonadota bacterium]
MRRKLCLRDTDETCTPSDAVEELLKRDPAGLYLKSDVPTRRAYRERIFALASRARQPAQTVGKLALDASIRAAERKDAIARTHIGYYLVDEGLHELMRALGVRQRFLRGVLHTITPRDRARMACLLYMWGVSLLTALFAAVIGAVEDERLATVGGWIALVFLSTPLAYTYASLCMRTLARKRALPRVLPALLREYALAEQECVMIVIPTIIASKARVRELGDMLLELLRAYPDRVFRFGLLSDFEDAAVERMPSDDTILEAARTLIDGLNQHHRDSLGDRFFLFHRHRAWSAAQGVWSGWERKRGKLIELNRLLTGRGPISFQWIVGDIAGLMRRCEIAYVVSRDEASWIGSDSTWRLLCAAAHPLNRAVIDDTNSVIRGYAIFQPGLSVLSPGALLHGKAAIEPGSGCPAVVQFPFDPLGLGIHRSWAALYDVESCSRLLDDAFPDDVVLHHDLIEGFVAHTGEVNGAVVYQERAQSYLARLSRGHRWLRGSFQLLLWSLPYARNARGFRVRNPLEPMARFYLVELALREMQKPATVALLIWGWLFRPSTMLWTIAVCPPLMILLVALPSLLYWRTVGASPSPRSSARWEVAGQVFAAVFGIVVLAIEAVVVLDALGRATWRLFVSRKHQIAWTTNRSLQAATPRDHVAYWMRYWQSSAIGITAFVATCICRPANVTGAIPITFAWMIAPAVLYYADRFVFAGD